VPEIPRESAADSTLALLRDPYHFIRKRCAQHGSDLFEARVLLARTICMSGRDAAELFYAPDRFQRAGAAPARIQRTLFGRGGVQGLDGSHHRRRKQLFLRLTTPDRVAALAAISRRCWERAAGTWAGQERIVLYDELHALLTRAVCEWAGVPLPDRDVRRRALELTALFDAAGAVGPRHWWSRLSRRRANHWVEELVRAVRNETLDVPPESAAAIVARYREADGELLPTKVAAVELLNVLRPTVAVSVYIVFAAVALTHHPDERDRLAAGDERDAERFVEEVRRFYPFFPAVTAVVRDDFEWRGYAFPAGRRVMLDLYGTNHDPRLWEAPERFRPERFRTRSPDRYTFIPQGGGYPEDNHRCPGEGIAVSLTQVAAQFLATGMSYEVPPQDLEIDESRLPALPRSRFVITNVRPTASAHSLAPD
jgi:fatty-acid peroxygenase